MLRCDVVDGCAPLAPHEEVPSARGARHPAVRWGPCQAKRPRRVKVRVAIIGDNAATRRLLTSVLRRADVRLKIIQWPSMLTELEPMTAPPDCVLFDCGTTDTGDTDCMRLVRERWPGVPLILITGAIAKGITIPPVLPPAVADGERERCLALIVNAVREALSSRRNE